MIYRFIQIIIFCLLLLSCEQAKNTKKDRNLKFEHKYQNSGFALVYIDKLENIKKLETRSLNIYHKSLKKKIDCKNY